MTAEYPRGDEPLIPMPALSLPALRQAVATVAPSRLPEFFQEIQDAFTQAGDEDSVFPIRHFYQRWGAAIAIERHECRQGYSRGGRQVGELLLSRAIQLPPVHASDTELGPDLLPAPPLFRRRRTLVSVGVDAS